MKIIDNQLKMTVKEVLLTIVFLCVIEMIAVFIFFGGLPFSITKERISAVLGVLAGSTVSCGVFYSIALSLETSADYSEEGATSHIRKTYIFRMLAVAAVMILTCITGWANILTLLVGIFNIKPAVYIYPKVHEAFGSDEGIVFGDPLDESEYEDLDALQEIAEISPGLYDKFFRDLSTENDYKDQTDRR